MIELFFLWRMLRTKLSIKKVNRANRSFPKSFHSKSYSKYKWYWSFKGSNIAGKKHSWDCSKLGILPLEETTSIQNDRPAIISVVTKTKIHHSLCTIGIVKQIILLTVMFFWYDSCPLDKPWAERIWGKMITSCPWQNTQTIYWPLSLITVPWYPFW